MDEDLLPDDAIDPPEPLPENPGNQEFNPNITWPTPSGITQDLATSSCEAPIRNLPIFPKCDEYTVEKRKPLVESCVADILVCSQ